MSRLPSWLVTHDEVVDRLPADIRDDFRSPLLLRVGSLTSAEAHEVAARWGPLRAAEVTVLGPGIEVFEIRRAEDPEPSFLVGQRGNLLSDEGVTALEVVSVAADGTVEVRSVDTRHAAEVDE